MKAVKSPWVILFWLFLNLGACKNESLEPLDGAWPSSYKIVKHIKNYKGIIRTIPFRPNQLDLYVIDVPNLVSTGSLDACNLPDSAKIAGLEVTFSGYILTFKGIDKVDIVANPFELTALNY